MNINKRGLTGNVKEKQYYIFNFIYVYENPYLCLG